MLSIANAIPASSMRQADRWIRAHPDIILAAAALASIMVLIAPWLLNGNMNIIFRYWDGPNYAYLAKALYSVPADHPLSPYVKPAYFAAHLPVYPLCIRFISLFGFDYNVAMLLTTMVFTVGATLVLFRLLSETGVVASPLWSAFIALFIPARYLIYHSVGATEAPFLFFTLYSLLCYIRGQYIAAFVLGGLSGITRITGVLIGASYFLHLLYKKNWRPMCYLPIIGLPLLATFVFYHFHYGNFFAYFGVNLSDKNSLLRARPFELFRVYSGSGKTHAAEFYLAMYAVYGAGMCRLWSKNRVMFFYVLVTFVFSCFIFHQDLSRYLVPLAPLALVVGYDDILSSRLARVAIVPYIVLCYIYAAGVIPHNLCVDWVYNNLLPELQR